MPNKFLRFVTAALMVFTIALPVLAQNPSNDQRAKEIRSLLDRRDREIKELLQSKKTLGVKDREQLKAMVNGIIDFRAMAEIALGPHWKEISPAQRDAFVDVFGEIVRSQSLSNLDVYRSKVTYDKISVDGATARVVTSVTYKDVPTQVQYLLSQREGDWRVNDILLDNVSTAEGYARSFQPVVKKRGFETLMTSLRKKLDKVTANS